MIGHSTVWRDLPEEFAPPAKAAAAIAKLRTLPEREAYFGRIPRQWHSIIRQLAIIGIAAEIVAMRELEARRRAFAEVPEGWGEDVKQHVLRLWQYNQKYGQGVA